VVESTALEMRHTGNRIVGSNPTLSAMTLLVQWIETRQCSLTRISGILTLESGILKIGNRLKIPLTDLSKII
jgi:hypothetical protein